MLTALVPLFRLALAHAILLNTNDSLHKAARIVHLLRMHQRLNNLDVMLFRPLLSALADPKRTLFAERYGFDEDNSLLNGFELDPDMPQQIDQSTEQLLAAYADLLWQRDNSDHLNPNLKP